jgi:hypothetical protein
LTLNHGNHISILVKKWKNFFSDISKLQMKIFILQKKHRKIKLSITEQYFKKKLDEKKIRELNQLILFRFFILI